MQKILQITSGRGPAECCRVVWQVLQLMLKVARRHGIACTVLQQEPGDEKDTLRSVCLQLEGAQTEVFAMDWLGSIQWIGESPFRKKHKRKNWFVGVAEVQKINKQVVLADSDITYQAIRSGGPGGQHVNKVSTAIRATYRPTGLSVLVSDTRSQLQNKKVAKDRLMTLLQLKNLEQEQLSQQTSWNNHCELQRGNPIRVFKGADFKDVSQQKSAIHSLNKRKKQI